MSMLVSPEEARRIAAEVEQMCHEAAVKAAEMTGISVEEGLRLEHMVSFDLDEDRSLRPAREIVFEDENCPKCGCPPTLYPDELAPHAPSDIIHWMLYGKPCPCCGWTEGVEPVTNWKEEGF
jgi:hypothetical protein